LPALLVAILPRLMRISSHRKYFTDERGQGLTHDCAEPSIHEFRNYSRLPREQRKVVT